MMLLMVVITCSDKEILQDFPNYRLPNFVTVEEMQSLLGKSFLYYPSVARFSVSDSFLDGMFGEEPAYI